MRQARRVTAAFAATLALASFAGCSGTPAASPSAGGATQTPAGSDSAAPIRVAFVAGITSDPFFRAMQLGAEDEAKKLGIELQWTGAPDEYSPESQIPFVDAALADQVDALVLVPTDPDSLQPSVEKAKQQGIPVITVDTTVTDQSYLTSHITGDNVQGGQEAAKTLAEQIGKSGEVFIMNGSPTATTNSLREKGFRDEMAASYPDIKIVGMEYANSQPAAATSAVNTAILKWPDLKGIFAIDGTSGTGSVAALRNNDQIGKIKLIGYDAYSNQVSELEEGAFSALIAQDPGQEARMALQYAKAKVTGEGADAIEKNVVIPNVVMTQDNLSTTKSYQYAE